MTCFMCYLLFKYQKKKLNLKNIDKHSFSLNEWCLQLFGHTLGKLQILLVLLCKFYAFSTKGSIFHTKIILKNFFFEKLLICIFIFLASGLYI